MFSTRPQPPESLPPRRAPFSSSPEILEARIAPAAFFLSPGFIFKDAAGSVVAGNAAAATAVGADFAIPLGKGDTLVLDANGNHLADPGETTLIKIASGRALAFFKDLDADEEYQDGEFTGLAFGGILGGTVKGTVNGSIASLLDGAGVFSAASFSLGAIKGFTVDGALLGNVLAGGAIEQLTVGKAGALSEVPLIAAGDAAASGESSFDGGETTLSPESLGADFSAAARSVQSVTVFGSVARVVAGHGAVGKAGGNIAKLTVTALTGALEIQSGDGGAAFATDRRALKAVAAGGGGAVSDIRVTNAGEASVAITAGAGGAGVAEYFEAITETVTRRVRSPEQDPETPGVEYDEIEIEVVRRKAGAVAALGAAGGSITGVTLSAVGGAFTEVALTAGSGGNGASIGVEAVVETVIRRVRSPEQDPETPGVEYDEIEVEVLRSRAYTRQGAGGGGGSVSKVALEALDGDFGSVQALAGNGGLAGGSRPGGKGGAIDKFTSVGDGSLGSVGLSAGSGAAGGEEGGEGGESESGAAGMAAGSVSNVTLHHVLTALTVTAGSGSAGGGGLAGGAGGSIKAVSAALATEATATLTAGSGGEGSVLMGTRRVRSAEQDPETPGTEYDEVEVVVRSGAGGGGGSLSQITLSALGDKAGSATLAAGHGGAAGIGKAGGKAGTIDGVGKGTSSTGSIGQLTLTGGNAGAGAKAVPGGGISGVSGNYDALIAIGGTGAEEGGGAGGGISKFKNLVVGTLQLTAAAGSASSGSGKGGDGGLITGIEARVSVSARIESGAGAAGSFEEAVVEERIRRVRSADQDPETPGVEYDEEPYEVIVRAPKAGAGGAGGKISGVTLTARGASPGTFELIAGAGGSNDAASEIVTDREGNPRLLGIGGAGGTLEAIRIVIEDDPAVADGSLESLLATAGAGGAGSKRGGAGGSVKLVAGIAQTLGSLALTGGDGGAGEIEGAGGSLLGSVAAGAPFEATLTPGGGSPAGKDQVVLTPPQAS